MRILHLASGNRWTGAAAPAFSEVEALRQRGIDAHYAYVGGYKLEAKIGHLDWTHPAIEKRQNPLAFRRSLRALHSLGTFDVVHAHLTWDHLLALALARRSGAQLARTFHARRVLRRDPLTGLLLRATPLRFSINAEFPQLDPPWTFTPPPLDERQFRADGANVRITYGIDATAPVVMAIGKLSPDRGFELVLTAFAAIAAQLPESRLMIVGHGPHRASLESMAGRLAIAPRVIWAGYHEEDLAEHYRAADVLLFTERGSDEGHRAVIEAMACGVAPVCAPLPGIAALVGGLPMSLIAATATGESLAACALPLLRSRDLSVRQLTVKQSRNFVFKAAAERLTAKYLHQS